MKHGVSFADIDPTVRRNAVHAFVTFLIATHIEAAVALSKPSPPWPEIPDDADGEDRLSSLSDAELERIIAAGGSRFSSDDDPIALHLNKGIETAANDSVEFDRCMRFLAEVRLRADDATWLWSKVPAFLGVELTDAG